MFSWQCNLHIFRGKHSTTIVFPLFVSATALFIVRWETDLWTSLAITFPHWCKPTITQEPSSQTEKQMSDTCRIYFWKKETYTKTNKPTIKTIKAPCNLGVLFPMTLVDITLLNTLFYHNKCHGNMIKWMKVLRVWSEALSHILTTTFNRGVNLLLTMCLFTRVKCWDTGTFCQHITDICTSTYNTKHVMLLRFPLVTTRRVGSQTICSGSEPSHLAKIQRCGHLWQAWTAHAWGSRWRP